jgi:hypothetical protein
MYAYTGKSPNVTPPRLEAAPTPRSAPAREPRTPVTPVTDASQGPQRYVGTAAAALFLDLSARTLEKYRVLGGGPEYRKFGRRVRYAIADLERWAEARRRVSTSDPG